MTTTLPRKSRLAELLSDRRLAVMAVLGVSSGMPYQLVYITQSAWLADARVPIGTIGLMSELTLAYKFKFLWAPFLDRYDAPILSRLLGRRRGWIILSQIAVAVALTGVAFGDPGHWLAYTIAFSLALGFAGATQDIVIDGWRINSAPTARQPLMASWAEVGYRIGVLIAGAGALFLADRIGWRGAYLFMAAMMAPGMAAALFAPEPPIDKTAIHHRSDIRATLVAPIKDLFARLGPMAWPILVMVAGFRMPGYVSNAMAVPLFKSLHYSNTDIATVTKLFGFWVGLGGTFLGSYLVPRLGLMSTLVLGTVAGSLSHLSLAVLAAYGDHGGGDVWIFAIAVGIDGFAFAFASIILISFMSTIATKELAGSQYALLTSLCAFPGSILAGLSGFVIGPLGFTDFFIGTSLIGVPVALLCLWISRRTAGQDLVSAEIA